MYGTGNKNDTLIVQMVRKAKLTILLYVAWLHVVQVLHDQSLELGNNKVVLTI